MPIDPIADELSLGEIVDQKYQVIRRLGEGGMGRVYAARRLTLGDTVAIKCILAHRDTAINRERFLREARAAARIRHPNVVQVFDFGELDDAGTPYMVMELLEGPTLSQITAQGPLPAEQALHLFAQICAAIEAGHRRGVVHRDIKPGNVIVARADDGTETVKVLDFGLARVTTGNEDLSEPQMLVGTADYMSPEQVRGDPVSPASDVFSLAVVLYELFMGTRPFSGTNLVNTLHRITQGEYEAVGPQVAPKVAEAITRGLKVEPSARPRSALALADLAGARAEDRRFGLEATMVASRPSERFSSKPSLGEAEGLSRTLPHEGSTFVGRDEEIAVLAEELRRAPEGAARFALITGDTGSGKTRLLDEMTTVYADAGAYLVRGKFFAYAADRPPPRDGLSWMVDAEGGAPDPGLDKWQMFDATIATLLERAGDQTLAIVLDDLQWAGTLDLELLSYLRFKARDRPLVIVATARLDHNDELRSLLAKLASTRSLRRLTIEPLSARATHAFLDAKFHPLRIAPQDLRRLHHVTSGSPFVLVELLEQLVGVGRIHREAEAWVCDDLFDMGLPDSVQTVVEARLSELPGTLRAVLELASVVGEEFRFDTILEACDHSEPQLEGLLEDAVERRILSERNLGPGIDFRFTSAVLRQVLYDRLSPRKRRRLHGQVVEALLMKPDAISRLADLLTYHHRAIADWEPTFEHGVEAAARAVASHDADAARTALEAAAEALTHIEPTSAQAARYEYLSGISGARLGRFDDAAASLQRVLGLADSLGDEVLRLDAELSLAECELGRGNFDACMRVASQAIERAQGFGDAPREYLGRIRLAQAAGPLGKIPVALESIAPVLATAEARFALHRALAGREKAWLLAKTGAFAEARAAAERALLEAREARDALAQYRAQSALGLVYAELGDHAAAIEQLELALELARALSLRRREGIELCNIAECRLLSGEASRGLQLTQEGLAIFVEVRDTASEGDCRVNIGRMLRMLGRRDEAIAMLDRGREACAASGRIEYEAVALTELAELRAEEGKALMARALYAQAARRYLGIGAFQHWQALFGVARMDAALGDRARARVSAEQALVKVEALLADAPAGVDPSTLTRSRSQIRQFLAEPEGETLIDVAPPEISRDVLERQHRSLQATAGKILGEIGKLHDASALVSVHRMLRTFDRKLREHSEAENSGAYLRLLRHDDSDLRERATQLYTQGVGLYERFFEFSGRWRELDQIEAERGVFADELVAVFRRLDERMRLEEQELHPLVERV